MNVIERFDAIQPGTMDQIAEFVATLTPEERLAVDAFLGAQVFECCVCGADVVGTDATDHMARYHPELIGEAVDALDRVHARRPA